LPLHPPVWAGFLSGLGFVRRASGRWWVIDSEGGWMPRHLTVHVDGAIKAERQKRSNDYGYIPRVGDISVEVHSKTKDPFWMIARRDKDGEWYLIRMALAFSDVQRYTDNMVQVGEERNTTYWRNKW